MTGAAPGLPALTTADAVVALLQRAARHRELRGRDLSILVELCGLLDTVEYRAVRVWYVAERLGVHPSQVSRALRTLADVGFLERSPAEGFERRFRLALPLAASRAA